jgi:hypothetical protein
MILSIGFPVAHARRTARSHRSKKKDSAQALLQKRTRTVFVCDLPEPEHRAGIRAISELSAYGGIAECQCSSIFFALLALGIAALWILTARGELPPDWDPVRSMSPAED